MGFFERYNLPVAKAICYSGFRDGQQPGGNTPTYAQVHEDLLILLPHWKYLRLYDCDEHAATVLTVIENEGLPFKILLGAYINAELNNENCPWGGGMYTAEQLENNSTSNQKKIEKLVAWSNRYAETIVALSVGNEACVEWTDHLVPVEKVIQYVQYVKDHAKQPVSFCENYVPWLYSLQPLATVVDFISIHSYPLWEGKTIEQALDVTVQNYEAVARLYPDKPVIITEAGWATKSNGRGMPPENATEENQHIYYRALMQWTEEKKILSFFFEAFDENWKGAADPLEPEKHWGLYNANRKPKMLLQALN